MNKLLHLNTDNFTIKSAEQDNESIEIEGFASTVDKDRGGDVISASSWKTGISEYLKNPVILAFHKHDNPVGKMVDHKVTEKGLWIKARISSSAGKVFNLIKDQVISAFSVGIMLKDAEYIPETDTFFITDLELHEISVVSVGANRNTLFDLSKALNEDTGLDTFKQLFIKNKEAKELKTLDSNNINNKEIEMDEIELTNLVAKTVSDTLAAEREAQKKEQDRIDAEAQKEVELNNKVKEVVVKTTEVGTEKLLKEFEKRMEEKSKENDEALNALRGELKDKAAELEAIQKSKMSFQEHGKDNISMGEKETAVMLSTITKKAVADTKYGKNLLEKAGPHLPSDTWELEVSRNLESEVRRRLVVSQTLRNIQMETNVITIPVNPEAGLATWVTNAQFGTTNSAGAAQTHALNEITLNAYKVATREYLNFEEEEDSLLPLMPIVRDAMIRRVARSVDRAFLRGAGTGADPVAGLTTYDAVASVTAPVANDITVADMIALREDLGAWGLDPTEVVYLVSTEAYYGLLKDANFQTMDKVGENATLLTGQIGAIGNSPVLVSGEFDVKAVGNTAAVAFTPGNFIVGNQRGLRLDTDDLVETQRKVLVASLRTGMVQTSTNLGSGVSKLDWVA